MYNLLISRVLNKTYFPLYKAKSGKWYRDMEKKNRQLRKAYVRYLTFL
nr:MAG TPA: hypothetical protein [Caudoviricetes sp.]